jgi:biopolymer transport protein ExbB/TolQ
VFLRALEACEGKEVPDFRDIQNAVDEATLELIPSLSKRTGYLGMFANVSVLFGLMGTIFGLILSFAAVGSDTGALTTGISTAMTTTFGGLVNAIPAILTYTYLSNKTAAIIDDIDEYSVKLIHLLTTRR